jgi:hypothetical protein
VETEIGWSAAVALAVHTATDGEKLTFVVTSSPARCAHAATEIGSLVRTARDAQTVTSGDVSKSRITSSMERVVPVDPEIG